MTGDLDLASIINVCIKKIILDSKVSNFNHFLTHRAKNISLLIKGMVMDAFQFVSKERSNEVPQLLLPSVLSIRILIVAAVINLHSPVHVCFLLCGGRQRRKIMIFTQEANPTIFKLSL